MTRSEVLNRIATVNDDTAYTWCLARCSALTKLRVENKTTTDSPLRYMALVNTCMNGRYEYVRTIQTELRQYGFDVRINMQNYELTLHDAE